MSYEKEQSLTKAYPTETLFTDRRYYRQGQHQQYQPQNRYQRSGPDSRRRQQCFIYKKDEYRS